MKRFQADFRAIAQFGALDNGGVTRLAFSRADNDARNYLISAAQRSGYDVSIDAGANIHIVRAGQNSSLAPVVMGSHLDTVPHGGHYDGVVGVLGGLEVLRRLDDAAISTERSVKLINFAAEESSRFGVANIGSKALTGKLTSAMCDTITDSKGNSLRQILAAAGNDYTEMAAQVLNPGDISAFVELHIEQGPVLEQRQLDIGVVTAIAAPSRFRATIRGRCDHSGNTPMHMRRDALVAAAMIVTEVEQLAIHGGEHTVATVGVLDVHHAAINVVPGEVDLLIDIRDSNDTDKRKAIAQLHKVCKRIAAARDITIDLNTISDDNAVTLDSQLADTIFNLAQANGLKATKMISGAGHDTMYMAAIAPSALIFIPSIAGISHNIAEKSTLEAIAAGVDLLYHTVLHLAQRR